MFSPCSRCVFPQSSAWTLHSPTEPGACRGVRSVGDPDWLRRAVTTVTTVVGCACAHLADPSLRKKKKKRKHDEGGGGLNVESAPTGAVGQRQNLTRILRETTEPLLQLNRPKAVGAVQPHGGGVSEG